MSPPRLKPRVDDKELAGILSNLKAKSSGRTSLDYVRMYGDQLRELIRVCEDLQDMRAFMKETSWLRSVLEPKRSRQCR